MVIQNGTASIILADRTVLLGRTPQPTCEIFLTDIEYHYIYDDNGTHVTSLILKGLAWGATDVGVLIENVIGQTLASGHSIVNNSKEWGLTFDLDSNPIPYNTIIRAITESNAPDSCAARAISTVDLGISQHVGSVLKPADGGDAGFESARGYYVGGHPDRFVFTRSYTPLIFSSFVTIGPGAAYMGNPFKDSMSLESLKRYNDMIKGLIHKEAEAGRKFQSGLPTEEIPDMHQVYKLSKKAFTNFLSSQRIEKQYLFCWDDIPDENSELIDFLIKSYKIDWIKEAKIQRLSKDTIEAYHEKEYLSLKLVSQNRVNLRIENAGRVTGTDTLTAEIENGRLNIYTNQDGYPTDQDIARAWEYHSINIGWLGIMFYDRMRFRASGLVAGEQVFSLGLAPGEEVTLTQQSQTKRSRSFEEVIDRETEKQLEFSSTWTTNISQNDMISDTFSFGENLGGNLGAPAEAGVTAGGQAGVNTQQSSSISENRQIARSTQATSRYTAKAREQHKITLKVGTEATEEFGSKRILRNTNPSKALMLHFHKIYQKYRVLLERHDAKLCCSFCLTDPGRDLRRELNDELDRLDPEVSLLPSSGCPDAPHGDEKPQEKEISGSPEYEDITFTFDLPPDTILADNSLNNCFQIKRWITTDWAQAPDHQGYERDASKFKDEGGSWGFVGDAPQIGASGLQTCTIRITIPGGLFWWTVSTKVSFTWKYVPTSDITKEYQDCIDTKKTELRTSFSMDKVRDILEKLKSGYRDLILKQAFEILQPGIDINTINQPCSFLEDVRNIFEWQEMAVEYLPWWMTLNGREEREKLRKRLLKLPGDVRSDLIIQDDIISSAARVYLPVKPGYEKKILAWAELDDEAKKYMTGYLEDFQDWRDREFEKLTHDLPDYEQVTATGAAVGTHTDETLWQHNWEKPRRKFNILDEWAELLPTDGVHIEPALSSCSSSDAYRTSALISDLNTAASSQEIAHARAELERRIAPESINLTLDLDDSKLQRT